MIEILLLCIIISFVFILYDHKSPKLTYKTKKKINEIQVKIKKLVKYMKKLYPNHKEIHKLSNNIIIKEIPNKYKNKVGYTLNKTKIYICLTDEKGDIYKNDNELYYIMLHELAHLITKSYHHTDEYMNNFKLIVRLAIKLHIYKYTNYNNTPKIYCNKLIDQIIDI